jgi:4-hydroxybenzoate polyprenyltransferase
MLRRIAVGASKELTTTKLKAYGRLGRYGNQIGTKLLFWPCAWGVALGATSPFSVPTLAALGLFWFGAFNLRSAGCGVNDLLDHKFDAQVERTKTRPIASGELTKTDAAKFVGAHLTGGLVTLAFMKGVAIKQSLMIFPLAMAYPLAKRYTHYAQAVLGLCFNSGIFIGFAQASGIGLFGPLLPFYCAGIMWTLIYDTVYALQDRTDDKKVGLKGLAVLWGKRTKDNCKKANILMLLSLLYGGYLFDLNLIYQVGTCVQAFVINKWIDEVKYKDPKSFFQFFNKHSKIGLAIFLLILFGRIGASKHYQTQGKNNQVADKAKTNN